MCIQHLNKVWHVSKEGDLANVEMHVIFIENTDVSHWPAVTYFMDLKFPINTCLSVEKEIFLSTNKAKFQNITKCRVPYDQNLVNKLLIRNEVTKR